MSQPKIGLVAVASIYEAGVDEVEGWMDSAIKHLQNKEAKVIGIKPELTDFSKLKRTVDQVKIEDVDLLLIINGTWASDSLQIAIIKEISKPTLLWALPYPKTFSLASVQHLSSVLKWLGIRFDYVYGSPDDEAVINRITKMAKISQLVNLWSRMRVGKVGRRFTWRTMGPADITYDELDLELTPGPSPIHIDIDELFTLVSKVSDSKAKELIDNMKKNRKLGLVEVKEKALIEATKVYFAVKELIKKYCLDAVTIECYPKYGGLDNVANSWLAEEGITSVCEGDLGHTALSLILQKLSGNPIGLLEPVMIEDEEDVLILRHDGAGAPSLSRDISEVTLKPVSEDSGVTVFSAVKPGIVTLATLWGKGKNHKMSILKGSTIRLTKGDVEKYGGGLVAKIKFRISARELTDRMINSGVDHHMLLALGDITTELMEFCRITGICLVAPDST
jgi:L-fucose isomerase-like protein